MRAYSCRGLHMLTRRHDVSESKFDLLIKTSSLTFPLAKRRITSRIQEDAVAALEVARGAAVLAGESAARSDSS
jgi:hypothetical protein